MVDQPGAAEAPGERELPAGAAGGGPAGLHAQPLASQQAGGRARPPLSPGRAPRPSALAEQARSRADGEGRVAEPRAGPSQGGAAANWGSRARDEGAEARRGARSPSVDRHVRQRTGSHGGLSRQGTPVPGAAQQQQQPPWEGMFEERPQHSGHGESELPGGGLGQEEVLQGATELDEALEDNRVDGHRRFAGGWQQQRQQQQQQQQRQSAPQDSRSQPVFSLPASGPGVPYPHGAPVPPAAGGHRGWAGGQHLSRGPHPASPGVSNWGRPVSPRLGAVARGPLAGMGTGRHAVSTVSPAGLRHQGVMATPRSGQPQGSGRPPAAKALTFYERPTAHPAAGYGMQAAGQGEQPVRGWGEAAAAAAAAYGGGYRESDRVAQHFGAGMGTGAPRAERPAEDPAPGGFPAPEMAWIREGVRKQLRSSARSNDKGNALTDATVFFLQQVDSYAQQAGTEWSLEEVRKMARASFNLSTYVNQCVQGLESSLGMAGVGMRGWEAVKSAAVQVAKDAMAGGAKKAWDALEDAELDGIDRRVYLGNLGRLLGGRELAENARQALHEMPLPGGVGRGGEQRWGAWVTAFDQALCLPANSLEAQHWKPEMVDSSPWAQVLAAMRLADALKATTGLVQPLLKRWTIGAGGDTREGGEGGGAGGSSSGGRGVGWDEGQRPQLQQQPQQQSLQQYPPQYPPLGPPQYPPQNLVQYPQPHPMAPFGNQPPGPYGHATPSVPLSVYGHAQYAVAPPTAQYGTGPGYLWEAGPSHSHAMALGPPGPPAAPPSAPPPAAGGFWPAHGAAMGPAGPGEGRSRAGGGGYGHGPAPYAGGSGAAGGAFAGGGRQGRGAGAGRAANMGPPAPGAPAPGAAPRATFRLEDLNAWRGGSGSACVAEDQDGAGEADDDVWTRPAADEAEVASVDLEEDPLLPLGDLTHVGGGEHVTGGAKLPGPQRGVSECGALEERELRQRLGSMRSALSKLLRGEAGAEEDTTAPGDFLQQLGELAPDPDRFQARGVHRSWRVWEAFLAAASPNGKLSSGAKEVLTLVRDGFKPTWVHPEAPGQQQAPEHRKKIQIVRQMLARSGRDPDAMLSCSEPQAVRFANHSSAAQHAEFVTAEIAKAAQQGAVRQWEGPSGPTVINGLRVVEKEGKRRLCINPMYVNAFMKYRPLKYEMLQDVSGYLERGDWMVTTDDKSGYWQLAIHPDKDRGAKVGS